LEIELRALKANPVPTDEKKENIERFYNTLRAQLVEEIERLERTYNEREDNLATDSDGRQIEVNSLKKALNEINELTASIEADYKLKTEELEEEKESKIRALQKELNYEISRSTQYLDSLNECKGELKSSYIQNKVQEKVQADTIEDKEKATKEIQKIQSKTKEKVEGNNEKIRAVEFQFTEEMKLVEQKYRTALAEKKALELQLKNSMDTSEFDSLLSESNKLQTTLKNFVATGGLGETRVRILAGELVKELLELQRTFEQRESDLIIDSDKVAMERKIIEESIDGLYTTLKEFVVSGGVEEKYATQIGELKEAINQLNEMTTTLNDLRSREEIGFIGSRKQLSKTLDKLNSFIRDSMTNDVNFDANIQGMLSTIKGTDDLQTGEEESTNAEIVNLSTELKRLQLRVRTLNAKDHEKRIAELETALARAREELKVSKKILSAHVDTINALEERIKLRGPNGKFNKDDEMVRVKMESLRLNTESKVLLSAKQKLETHYTNQIQALNERYMKKTEDYEVIQAKFNDLNDSVVGKAEEELRAWQKRSENLRAAVSALEGETADLNLKNEEITKFRSQDDELYMEENKGLKEETEKREKEWEMRQENWKLEKRLMCNEITVLKHKAEIVQVIIKQMTELLKEKVRIADLKRDSLKAMEDTYQITIEGLKHSTQAIINWISKEEIMKKADEESIELLKEYVQDLKRIIGEVSEGHAKEVAVIISNSNSKIAILNEKKTNALFEAEALRNQIKIYKENLIRLQKIREVELKVRTDLQEELKNKDEDTLSQKDSIAIEVMERVEEKTPTKEKFEVVPEKLELAQERRKSAKSSPKTPGKSRASPKTLPKTKASPKTKISPKISPKKESKKTAIKLNKMNQ